jgi:hypothetical protein
MTLIINSIQLQGKISGEQGRLVTRARLMVTSLYSLKIEGKLQCLQQVSALLNDDSCIGKWADLLNSIKKVRLFERREPATLIFAHFFPSLPTPTLADKSIATNFGTSE